MLTDVGPYTEIFVLTFLVTGAADLAGFAWVNFIDGDTGPFCLVLHQFYEACPIQHLNIDLFKPPLAAAPLGKYLPFSSCLTFGLLHHMVHREIFKDDRLKGINQDASLLMVEVSSLVPNLLMSLANRFDCFLAAIALVFPFGESLLQLLEPAM